MDLHLANRNAESIMKPIGKVIKTATLEGKNWRQELQRFLLNYRSTPHAITKVDGRPRLRNITFDGISLLEAGNTNKSICLCLIMQV